MSCTLIVSQRRIPLPATLLAAKLRRVRDAAGYSGWDLGCRVTNDRAIAALNSRYRGRRGPTDILSFAFHELPAPEAFPPGLPLEERNLGDLVISAPAVARHCAEHGVDPLDHYDVLFAHGVAHLLGYDHETEVEHAAMAAVEARLLRVVAAAATVEEAASGTAERVRRTGS